MYLRNDLELKLLFVCGRGVRRSATAERIFWNDARFKVRSGGTAQGSRRRVTAEDVRWSDLVVVMEDKYFQRLKEMFPSAMEGAVVRALDIEDEYEFMDEDLIREIELGMEEILSVFDSGE